MGRGPKGTCGPVRCRRVGHQQRDAGSFCGEIRNSRPRSHLRSVAAPGFRFQPAAGPGFHAGSGIHGGRNGRKRGRRYLVNLPGSRGTRTEQQALRCPASDGRPPSGKLRSYLRPRNTAPGPGPSRQPRACKSTRSHRPLRDPGPDDQGNFASETRQLANLPERARPSTERWALRCPVSDPRPPAGRLRSYPRPRTTSVPGPPHGVPRSPRREFRRIPRRRGGGLLRSGR
jgi:hypothetical protein